MTKPLVLKPLELPSSEKQIPQVIENIGNGWNSKEALERADVRPRQVRYQAALRPDIKGLIINQLAVSERSQRERKARQLTPTTASQTPRC